MNMTSDDKGNTSGTQHGIPDTIVVTEMKNPNQITDDDIRQSNSILKFSSFHNIRVSNPSMAASIRDQMMAEDHYYGSILVQKHILTVSRRESNFSKRNFSTFIRNSPDAHPDHPNSKNRRPSSKSLLLH